MPVVARPPLARGTLQSHPVWKAYATRAGLSLRYSCTEPGPGVGVDSPSTSWLHNPARAPSLHAFLWVNRFLLWVWLPFRTHMAFMVPHFPSSTCPFPENWPHLLPA